MIEDMEKAMGITRNKMKMKTHGRKFFQKCALAVVVLRPSEKLQEKPAELRVDGRTEKKRKLSVP